VKKRYGLRGDLADKNQDFKNKKREQGKNSSTVSWQKKEKGELRGEKEADQRRGRGRTLAGGGVSFRSKEKKMGVR